MGSNRAREAIRADVLRDYEAPRPGLEARIFAELERQPAGGSSSHHPRRALRVAAVVAIAVVVTIVLLAHTIVEGGMTVPAWAPFGGLRPPTSDMSIVDAQFVSADVGWVFVQRNVTSGPHALFKTSDGGRHWTEQLYFANGTGGIESMRFWPDGRGEVHWLERPSAPTPAPGKQQAPVVNEVVYATSDGGAHWTRNVQPSTLLLSQGFFISPDEGWAIDRSGRPGNQAATLVHTVDGGKTWTRVADLAAAGLPSTPNGAILFRDPSTGWLTVFDSRSIGADASGQPFNRVVATTYLYITTDGGKTWTGQALPLPAEAEALDVRVWSPVFFSPTDGVLPVQAIDVAGASAGPSAHSRNYLLRTVDGGRTWASPVLLPGGLDHGGELLLSPTHWLIGDGPDLRETLDGGRAWESRRVLAGSQALDLAPWDYIDQRAIWSQVGAGGLVRSADGGRTWSTVRPPLSSDIRPRALPA